MEVLAGDEDFEVSVKESGATFSFNFKDVYWNSRCGAAFATATPVHSSPLTHVANLFVPCNIRLGTEHNRIISSIVQAEAARSSQLGKRSREAADSAAAPTKQPLPVIADMMGGVGQFSCFAAYLLQYHLTTSPLRLLFAGPFSVPLAKSRSCEVHCNGRHAVMKLLLFRTPATLCCCC